MLARLGGVRLQLDDEASRMVLPPAGALFGTGGPAIVVDMERGGCEGWLPADGDHSEKWNNPGPGGPV